MMILDTAEHIGSLRGICTQMNTGRQINVKESNQRTA